MNKLLKTGLLLQVPNAYLLLALGVIFILPYITLDLIFLVIYVLLNIASAIYIVLGLMDGEKHGKN